MSRSERRRAPLTTLLLVSAVTVGVAATAAAGTGGDAAADTIATADRVPTVTAGPPTAVTVAAATVGFGPGRDTAAVLVEATREADDADADAGDAVDALDAADAAAREDAADAEASPAWVAADGDRIDAERIRAFLTDRGAPLAAYADELVAAGIRHDVDPRLVVAIAVAESSAGDRKPSGTHNAWGWSGSGPHGLKVWASWPEAIDDFTERLGRLYDTTSVDEDMARTYCPPNWRWWLDTVQWAIGRI